MKRKLLRLSLGAVIFAALMLPSCDECGTCELVTIDESTNEYSYGTPLIFCGDAYYDKLDSTPVSFGGFTTYWECD